MDVNLQLPAGLLAFKAAHSLIVVCDRRVYACSACLRLRHSIYLMKRFLDPKQLLISQCHTDCLPEEYVYLMSHMGMDWYCRLCKFTQEPLLEGCKQALLGNRPQDTTHVLCVAAMQGLLSTQ